MMPDDPRSSLVILLLAAMAAIGVIDMLAGDYAVGLAVMLLAVANAILLS